MGADDARREIPAVIRQLDPQVAPTPIRTLAERMAGQMGRPRLGATVLGALGAIAVLLTLLGTYVVADSMASSRMKEMGIRAALGATRRQLGSIVLAHIARFTGLGVFAGLGLAWLGTTTIRSFLVQVRPLDCVHARIGICSHTGACARHCVSRAWVLLRSSVTSSRVHREKPCIHVRASRSRPIALS